MHVLHVRTTQTHESSCLHKDCHPIMRLCVLKLLHALSRTCSSYTVETLKMHARTYTLTQTCACACTHAHTFVCTPVQRKGRDELNEPQPPVVLIHERIEQKEAQQARSQHIPVCMLCTYMCV